MGRVSRRAVSLAFLLCLSGCTSTGATKRGIVGFNRVFADARNEILLINILRARDGDPQQFSTVSNVNGAMRPQIELAAELANISDSIRKVFKPSGTFAFRNPTITIAPLETKEFRAGMMKPVDPELVANLLRAGWDQDVVFHLVLAGPPCVTNVTPMRSNVVFLRDLSWATKDPTEETVIRRVSLRSDLAMKMLREGGGDGVTIEIDKSDGAPKNYVNLVIKKKGEPRKTLLKGGPCDARGTDVSKVSFRSPLGMIQYLGQLIRGPAPRFAPGSASGNEYFTVVQGLRTIPPEALVGTRQDHAIYYVPRYDTSGRWSKSAQTLALLAEIIGFQTTDATLNASKPAVTVPSGE